MLKKGRKREAKGLAVLYFIIGLIILFIILAVIYFALAKLDYSDKLDPETTMRPYVEGTVDEDPSLSSDFPSGEETVQLIPQDDVDLTGGDEEPADLPTEEPTPLPTEEPTPEPTEEPTPEPTALPADQVAQPMAQTPSLPAMASENGKTAITDCYVSQADNNQIMALTGYGYVDEADFDGAQAKSWLIVSQVTSGKYQAYPLTLGNGLSGVTHDDAVCKNADSCDFNVYLDVSQYDEGIYSLALVIGYVKDGEKKVTYKYYPFGDDISFTVLDHQVITPVSTTQAG